MVALRTTAWKHFVVVLKVSSFVRCFFTQIVLGLYVQTVHRPANRIMKIQDLLNETARSSILTENERYGKMTIEQYFKERYNMQLKYVSFFFLNEL